MDAVTSRRYKAYALVLMTAVYMLNLVDRGLMVLLLHPIGEDLKLSDTQLGFLTGIAFGLFYATLGLPIARWADRGNRVTITSLAIGLWGVTVMGCLIVTSYAQLVLARIAAAVGEAGCKPPTYSLIGDYFPEPAARTRALAVYSTGSPGAALISFIVGGWLNEHYGWRLTFFLMGVPALILMAIVKWTLVEPRLHAPMDIQQRSLPPMTEVMRKLWRQPSLRNLCMALVLLYTMGMGLAPWYSAFMIRSHGMGTSELGLWLGLIMGVGGIAGLVLGGYVSARWLAGNERAQMRLTALSVASLVPCFVAFLMLPQKNQSLIALIPLMVAFNIFLGPIYALMQRLVADQMRATMMSLVMLLANLAGFGLGPLVVGITSDALRSILGNDSLRYAMLMMSFIAFWAAYHFWRVGQTVNEDLSKVAREVASHGGVTPSDLVPKTVIAR